MILYNKKTMKKSCRVDYIDGHFKEDDFDTYVKKLALKCDFDHANRYIWSCCLFFVDFGLM